MPLENWGTSLRDVLADAEYRVELGELNATFKGFYESEGEKYQKPYKNVIDRIGRSISETRLETLKKLLDSLGLIFVDGGIIQSTALGRRFYENWLEINSFKEQSNQRLAEFVVATLGRYQLLNPTTNNRDYPPDADIHPYRAIWQAMLELDGRIHDEEFNRVILKVMYERDLDVAIQKIKSARDTAGYNPTDVALMNHFYGPRVFEDEDQVTRRMTPWFALAGFGGLLINRESEGGYRIIRQEYLAHIKLELTKKVTYRDFGNDTTAYIEFLNAASETKLPANISASETEIFNRALQVCKLNGSRRFIMLSGVAGTGKTRLSAKLGDALTAGDKTRYFEIQFHESYSYDDFIEGLIPTKTGGFTPQSKIFRKANARAHEMESVGSDAYVVLVIEEFSRANLSNVLGELLTYIEHRNRSFDYPLTGDQDNISPNLIIIGTLNPLDRSVLEMDDALIRRMRRIEIAYSDLALREMLSENGVGDDVILKISQCMHVMAPRLPFGHGVFADVQSEEDLHYLWQEQLLHYFIKATGQIHPAYEEFLKLYPWVEKSYRAPSVAPALGEVIEPTT